MRVDDAAEILDLAVVTLRRAIERHARRDAEGRIHASFDGVHARKIGRHWRVLLDDCWTGAEPAHATDRVLSFAPQKRTSLPKGKRQ
jgi:hypothetical protein